MCCFHSVCFYGKIETGLKCLKACERTDSYNGVTLGKDVYVLPKTRESVFLWNGKQITKMTLLNFSKLEIKYCLKNADSPNCLKRCLKKSNSDSSHIKTIIEWRDNKEKVFPFLQSLEKKRKAQGGVYTPDFRRLGQILWMTFRRH